MKPTESQEKQILDYMETGRSLTGYQMLVKFGTMNHKGRIHRLRSQGHNIEDEWIVTSTKKRIKKYYLKRV